MLERLKREDETIDELLMCILQIENPIAIGAWTEEDAKRARTAVQRSRESFER